jgi:hypothetical protein
LLLYNSDILNKSVIIMFQSIEDFIEEKTDFYMELISCETPTLNKNGSYSVTYEFINEHGFELSGSICFSIFELIDFVYTSIDNNNDVE